MMWWWRAGSLELLHDRKGLLSIANAGPSALLVPARLPPAWPGCMTATYWLDAVFQGTPGAGGMRLFQDA